MRKYFLSFVFLFLSLCGLSQQVASPFVPSAKSYIPTKQYVAFKNFMIVNKVPDARSLCNLFKQELEWLNLLSDQKKENTVSIIFEKKKIHDKHPDGYTIILNETITLQANTHKGWLYGTRTLLQLLVGENKFRKAAIVDYPVYEKRMLLLDVARKFFSFNQLKDFIRAMAWVKMNELHLHLSDNSWGGYSAYRLPSKLYPNLTAKDGHYSWEQIEQLQDFAKSYGVTITPEIDSPGHSLAFTKVRPDLKSPWLNSNYLDITNQETYSFMKNIFQEVIPHFEAPDFHLGTDEYRLHSIKDNSNGWSKDAAVGKKCQVILGHS